MSPFQVNSVWFKLYTYYLTGSGPPSLLLVKGTKLRKLPKVLLVSVFKMLQVNILQPAVGEINRPQIYIIITPTYEVCGGM